MEELLDRQILEGYLITVLVLYPATSLDCFPDIFLPHLISAQAVIPVIAFITFIALGPHAGVLVSYPPVSVLNVRNKPISSIISGQEPIEINHRCVRPIPLFSRVMRIIHTRSDIFLPKFVGRLAVPAVFAVNSILAVFAVLAVNSIPALQIEEEMGEIHGAGIVYEFLFHSFYPKLVSRHPVLSRQALHSLLTTRADRHSHLKRVAGGCHRNSQEHHNQ